MLAQGRGPCWHQAAAGRGRRVRERCGEEGGELSSRHLARGKGKLAMADRAKPTDVPVDGHIVGRIGKNEVGPFISEKACHMLGQ
jgi:hypothetical protein